VGGSRGVDPREEEWEKREEDVLKAVRGGRVYRIVSPGAFAVGLKPDWEC